MANPYHHACSSMRLFKVTFNDAFPIHRWFDLSKMAYPGMQHRFFRHTTVGRVHANRIFKDAPGLTFDLVEKITEQHINEDFGFIPEPAAWLEDVDINDIPVWANKKVVSIEQMARRSAVNYGGIPEDYTPLHSFFDEFNPSGDSRYKALTYHALGCYTLEDLFGPGYSRPSDGKVIPTRWFAEEHIARSLGVIPTLEDWVKMFPPLYKMRWVSSGARSLSKELLFHEEFFARQGINLLDMETK